MVPYFGTPDKAAVLKKVQGEKAYISEET